jgi:hypothetical protein
VVVGPRESSCVVGVVEVLGAVVVGGASGRVVATWPPTSVTTVRLAITTVLWEDDPEEEGGTVDEFAGAAGVDAVAAAPVGAGSRITDGVPLTGV